MFFDKYEMLCKEKGKTPTGVAVELGIGRATVSYWKSGKTPKQVILNKIAEYFDVTTDYLLGNSNDRKPINTDITDNDIKFALFGGDGEITDEMYDDVKKFAQFIKEKYENDKKE